MNSLLKLEELAHFILGIFLFSQTSYAWWWFPALILLPDLSMIGYAFNSKTGALLYNIFHHKALGILFFIVGQYLVLEPLTLTGIILFSHSAMDRIFGYGLKYKTSFHHTHLGKIGHQS
ncbi:DUF4260 domain-containing protein [Jiulongibacter sp. NS-SX5]|uniref:DUF4260 domain-containing protein n=1 Tax=Jiulongibacter sp. NS-SX5 TaxID=3463854 RepID=UPI00405838C7